MDIYLKKILYSTLDALLDPTHLLEKNISVLDNKIPP